MNTNVVDPEAFNSPHEAAVFDSFVHAAKPGSVLLFRGRAAGGRALAATVQRATSLKVQFCNTLDVDDLDDGADPFYLACTAAGRLNALIGATSPHILVAGLAAYGDQIEPLLTGTDVSACEVEWTVLGATMERAAGHNFNSVATVTERQGLCDFPDGDELEYLDAAIHWFRLSGVTLDNVSALTDDRARELSRAIGNDHTTDDWLRAAEGVNDLVGTDAAEVLSAIARRLN